MWQWPQRLGNCIHRMRSVLSTGRSREARVIGEVEAANGLAAMAAVAGTDHCATAGIGLPI